MTAVCASAYAASLMTMLGTCYLLSKTSLSPANVQTSMTTIYNSMSSGDGCETIIDDVNDDVTDVDVVSNLIVASLSSADSRDSQVRHVLPFAKPGSRLLVIGCQGSQFSS